MKHRVGILGSKGKMGQRVIAMIAEASDFSVAEDLDDADVLIDFSSYTALPDHLSRARSAKTPLVVGTTGHGENAQQILDEAAKEIPILFSPNFSIGIALCMQAAKLFAPYFKNIEIEEVHHTQKKDAPSGAALAFAKALHCDPKAVRSTRTGTVIGEHTLIFSNENERIELKHNAFSRDIFAQGALQAARFLLKQPAGLYTFKEVFT